MGRPKAVESETQCGGLWAVLRVDSISGTVILLCPSRLNPDSQGPCFHLMNDGLNYEQTGLFEHFGAGASSWLLLQKHPRDPRSAHRAQPSAHYRIQIMLGSTEEESLVFYLKCLNRFSLNFLLSLKGQGEVRIFFFLIEIRSEGKDSAM